MERFGSITPLEAFRDLGITKLATRISEMRRNGILVLGDWVETENRFGETVRFKRYKLEATE